VTVLVLLFGGLSLAQTLSDQQQASLDGRYAGLRQKKINAIRVALAQGRLTSAEADKEVAELTQYIANLRNRWRPTKFARVFENSFNYELRYVDPANPRPQLPGREPFRLGWFMKLILLVAGYFVCKKFWNAPLGMVAPKAKAGDDLIFLTLTPEEQTQIQDAEKAFEAREKELKDGLAQWQKYAAKLESDAAGLAQKAGALADRFATAGAQALNQAIPEFDAYNAEMQQKFPLSLAPWSSTAIWDSFAAAPSPEILRYVRYGQTEEAKRLAGDKGIVSPRNGALLAAKGPMVVRCDAASKAKSRAVIQNVVLRAALGSPSETRFALIDPYGLGAAFPMRGLLPRVRPSARTPADELAEVVDDIRRINEAVVGQAESFASLSREKRAGEMFEIVVALDYPKAYERDPRALEYLARVAQSGPRAGRHLILEWDGGPSTTDLAKFENHVLIDVMNASSTLQFDDAAPADLQRKLLTAVAAVRTRPTGGDWNSLVRPAEGLMTHSSARMVEAIVGERLKIWFGDNQDGKPCAHAMLAGQTGSGKSFLLHVFITGLSARYSPKELKLVLVDGKQGVEFEAYKTLPHAKVVCLRTSPAVARSVLDDFVAEMEERYVEFQRHGVTKLEDYRRKTGEVMPRMLMVVDEYQQLLDGDPDRGAQMLSRILEKGRAAGIHLLLGSQTFEVRGFPASAMTHVHLRAALSLPIDYIQSLNAFGPEGKKLIRDLSPSGQVVINDESGRDGANARGAVARLDAAAGCSLGQVVTELVKAAASPGVAPVVLSGNDAAVLASNVFIRRWRSSPPGVEELQRTARMPQREGGFGVSAWSAADRPIPLWLGRKFDVHGHLLAVLRRAPGHNLLALGSETHVRLSMLANGVAGLRAMMPMAGVEVLLLDGLSEGQPGAGLLATGVRTLQAAGASVLVAAPAAAADALERFAVPRQSDGLKLLILSEPEYFPILAAPSGFGAPPAGPSRTFKELLRNGPSQGTHAIVTATGVGSLSTAIHASRDAALFNHRVVQQSNEEDSMTLFSSMDAARIMSRTDHHMAAMYVDSVQGVKAAQLFKAYAANENLYGDQSAAALAKNLKDLFAS